jgi:hypothetical protein
MQTRHNELRDELVAILGAGRELSEETDVQLAEAFLHYLDTQQERETAAVVPAETPHQPHYSLMAAGGMWGAALMFLFLLLTLDAPNPIAVLMVSIVVLSLVAAITRAFVYLARYGWQLPRVHVKVAPPTGRPQGRS